MSIKKEKRFILFKEAADIHKLFREMRPTDTHTLEINELKYSSTLIPYNEKPIIQDKNYWTIISIDHHRFNLSSTNILYEASFFTAENGTELGLSHLFYVRLFEPEDLYKLEKLAKENGVEILGKNSFMNSWYILSCDKKSKGNALEMANIFYETGLFSAAQPDLMEDNLTNSLNDTYFPDQWYLSNTGQAGGINGIDIKAGSAWNVTQGNSDIIVAVLDHGLELNHPDMTNISSISFNTETGTSPSLVLGPHGVPVGGIVAATSNNNQGVVGVAPQTTLLSISNSLNLQPNASQLLSDGINFAWSNGAHVINNSWGHNSLQSSILDDAINNALTYGRGGLGTVIIFASGNNNSNTSNYPANSNPLILNVGAVDRCGIRSGRIGIITEATPCDPWCTTCNPGSAYGPSLDVVAGGSTISSTDRQGIEGYNPFNTYIGDYTNLDYTRYFGGTSAAAPQVAGVAALILSINPNLTVLEVNNIIERTAQKIRPDVYSYTTTSGRPNGTWNQYLGYGMVNACLAVQLANTAITGPDFICDPSVYTISNLPTGATVSWSIPAPYSIVGSSTGTSVTVQSSANIGGTLTAVITTDCGEYTLTKYLNRKELEIVMEPGIPCGNATVIADVGSNPGTYTWTVTGDLAINGGGQTLVTSSNIIQVSGLTGGNISVSITGACPYTISMEEVYVPYREAQIGSHNNFPMMQGDPLTAFVEDYEREGSVLTYRWILNDNLIHSGSSPEYNSNEDGGAWALECGMNLLVVEALMDCGTTVKVGQMEFERMCE